MSVIAALALLAFLGGAALAARRHLRRGRADRTSADRLWMVIVAVMVAAWALGAHHAANISVETNNLLLAIAGALLQAGVLWLCYLALEPLVRKWEPRVLVGWTRLLGGNLRDPQVGRDLLAGIAGGVIWALIRAPRGLPGELAGNPPIPPLTTNLGPLLGIRDTLAIVLDLLPQVVTTGMELILVFAFARTFLRSTRATVVAGVVLLLGIVGAELSSEQAWPDIFLVVPGVALIFLMVVRFGLLSTIVMFYIGRLCETIPLTADPAMRYFPHSAWTLAAVFAFALFAAFAARAGQPLLKLAD
jgi:serine/threonine-protein kinase